MLSNLKQISRVIKSIIIYLNGYQMKTPCTKFESLFTYLIQIWVIEGILDCPLLMKAILIIVIINNESNFQMEFPRKKVIISIDKFKNILSLCLREIRNNEYKFNI